MKHLCISFFLVMFGITAYSQQSLEVTFSQKSFNECYGITSIDEIQEIPFLVSDNTLVVDATCTVRIVSMQGVEVFSAQGKNSYSLQHIDAGVYVLEILHNNRITRKKISL